MLPPVLGGSVIDYASPLVEDWLRVAVIPGGRIHCLPDIELLAGPAVIAESRFIRDIVTHRDECVAQIVAHCRLLDFFVCSREIKNILLVIEICRQEGAEVYRVRASDERAV